jgi:membrane-associated phospholipid phosphatase
MDAVYFLQQFASPALTEVALFVTNLGSERAYIAFLLVVYLAVDARFGRYLGMTFLLGYFLNFHLKGIIDTPRPYVLDASVGLTPEAVATGLGAAFPSGHAQASVMFWALVASYVRKPWFWLVTALLVSVISVTRVYLGLHIPLDIWGGWLIGAGVVWLGLRVYQMIIRKDVPTWYAYLVSSPKSLQIALAIFLPLLLHLLLGVADSEVIMGGLAAFAVAPLLVPYRVPQSVVKRIAVVGLGLVLTFAVLLGSSLLLPEALKRDALIAFVRYFVIGSTGIVITPLLIQRLGWLPPDVNPSTAEL